MTRAWYDIFARKSKFTLFVRTTPPVTKAGGRLAQEAADRSYKASTKLFEALIPNANSVETVDGGQRLITFITAKRKPRIKCEIGLVHSFGDTNLYAKKLEPKDMRQVVAYVVWLAKRDGIDLSKVKASDLQKSLSGLSQNGIFSEHTIVQLQNGRRKIQATAVNFYEIGGSCIRIEIPHVGYDAFAPIDQLEDDTIGVPA